MSLRQFILAFQFIIVALVLSGCFKNPWYDDSDPRVEAAKLKTKLQKERFNFETVPKTGVTYLSYDFQHGFQVTYYENENKVWLWYGGNDVALPAAWKITENIDAKSEDFRWSACFKYGPDTYNPATKKSVGQYECTLAVNVLNLWVGMIDGDLFNLSSGEVPYVREKCDAPNEFKIMSEYSVIYNPVIDCKK